MPQAQLRKQQRCPPSVDSTGSVAEALALACPGERVQKEGVLDNCAYSVDLVLPERRLAVEVLFNDWLQWQIAFLVRLEMPRHRIVWRMGPGKTNLQKERLGARFGFEPPFGEIAHKKI